MGAPWDLMEPRLREMARAEHSPQEIAATLSTEFNQAITRNAVLGRARRSGIQIESDPKRSAVSRRMHIKRQLEKVRLGQRKPSLAAEIERLFPAARSEPEPVYEAPVPTAGRVYGPVSLMDARMDQCRFIEGEPSGSEPCFCGLKVPAGSSYCEPHAARVRNAYQPKPRSEAHVAADERRSASQKKAIAASENRRLMPLFA